jgi:hypothetical protein
MKKSLYNITEEQNQIINAIYLLDGEITPEIEQRLIITKNEIQNKSIAYLSVIKKCEGNNTLIKEEIKRLQTLVKRNDNIVSRLKDNLLNAVKTFGDIEVGFNKFTTRKSSSVIVEDVNSLPKEFKVIKVTEQADKKALKDALNNGEIIKGVYIQDNKNLKIN